MILEVLQLFLGMVDICAVRRLGKYVRHGPFSQGRDLTLRQELK